ncbi:MAG: tyrosine-type recombinase/integrase [Chromatiales bacterium]|nr:tyrosine-type recombinase/integrase [Chromatiales bacterium]
MASITKTRHNTWKAIVRRRGWPVSIRTFRTKRDAADWARRIEDEMTRAVYVDRAGAALLTLEAALDRYLREVSRYKAPRTLASDETRAKALREKLGRYSLAAITPDVVAQYRDTRLAEGKANDTVRLDLALLSHLFRIAQQEWRVGIPFNPVAQIRKPPAGRGRDRRLDADEERRLLAAVDAHSNPMLGWIVRIALYTAMRKSEILTLHRSQIDLERRIVRLDHTKNGDARTVPLSRKARIVLAWAMRHTNRLTLSGVRTPLLFFGDPGRDRRRRPYAFDKVWQNAVERAGLDNLRFHDLRHEAVSRFVEAGLTDQQVSAISGHKSMQMLKRYTHLRGEDLVGTLDRVMS